MKDNIIALAIVLAIWGIPFALGVEVVPYWENAFDFFFIPILIYVFFSKGGLYSFLKDIHQNNLQDIEEQNLESHN